MNFTYIFTSNQFLRIISVVCLLFAFTINAQDTAFIYTYGGEGNDECRGIAPTHDNGFVLAGSTGSFGKGNSDLYLIKVDSNFQKKWSTTIGGANIEQGTAICPTQDSGFVISGYANDLFGKKSYDMLLTKVDSSGTEMWRKRYGGPEREFAYDVIELTDQGFMIVGETHSYGSGNSDAYLLRTDQDGDTLWSLLMGETQMDGFRTITETFDGNYVVAGYTTPQGESRINVLLVKISTSGQILWTKTFDLGGENMGIDIKQTLDSGLIFAGQRSGLSGGTDKNEFLMKTDSLGNSLWVKTHQVNSTGANRDDIGRWVIPLPTGRYIYGGVNRTFGGVSGDFFAISTTEFGNWTAASWVLGSTDYDESFDALLNKDDELIVVGTTDGFGQGFTDMMLIHFPKVVGGPETVLESFRDTLALNVSITNPLENENFRASFYPNPFVESTQMMIEGHTFHENWDFSLFDLNGRLVYSKRLSPQENTFQLERSSLRPGMYLFEIRENGVPLQRGKLNAH